MVDLAPNVRVVGAEIRRQRRLLEVFNARTRNQIIRECMRHAGEMWRATYVPMRFTDYAKKAPFSYRLTPSGAWKRMQAKGGLFERMAQQYDGSNPYPGNGAAPRIVYGPAYERWLKEQQRMGRYRFSLTGNFSGAKADYRVWLGAKFREAAKNWYTDNAKDAAPLMMTGQLSRTVMTGRVVARATANMASVAITLPRGDRQNPWARRVLGTVPVKEAQHVARWMAQRFSRELAGAIAIREEQQALAVAKAKLREQASKERTRTTKARQRSADMAVPRRAA